MKSAQDLINKTLELAQRATGTGPHALTYETFLFEHGDKLARALKEAVEALNDLRDMVNELECRGDEDCDHCVIVYHAIDPALSTIDAICSEGSEK